jgi:hypothetical protein
VDLTNFVGLSSVIEDTLGGGSFAGVYVGHDTNVTVHGELYFAVFGGRSFLEVDLLGLGNGFVEDDQ